MYCSNESISLAYIKSLKIFKANTFFRLVFGHVERVEVVVQMGRLDMPVNGGPGTIFLYCSILSEDANF